MHEWFKAGLPFVQNLFPEEWSNDAKIFLLVAEHSDPSGDDLSIQSFRHASAKLKASKDFMLKAIEHNSFAVLYADGSLRKDFDIILTALAASEPLKKQRKSFAWRFCRANNTNYLNALRAKMEAKLVAHSVFTTIFLPGIALSTDPTALALLNQGQETSLGYTERMAEFLDVPRGKQLKNLRRAFDHFQTAKTTPSVLKVTFPYGYPGQDDTFGDYGKPFYCESGGDY